MIENGIRTLGYGSENKHAKLKPVEFGRREVGPNDVLLDILFCGVCHSDIHQARDEWHNTVWPCVPGHEIVGRVVETGANVTRFRTGDIGAVGCMVDSCQQCPSCKAGEEQYCEGPHSWTATYNGPMKPDGTNTFGGYSQRVVVTEKFVLRLPDGMDHASAAPLLCSAVTVYSPMKHFKIGAGQKVGIIGIGGLGHIAIKIANALGAQVTAFTRTPAKKADALRFGATDVVDSNDKKQMDALAGSYDYLLSTVPEPHDVNPYVKLLKRDGRITLVGVLAPLDNVSNMQLASQRISFGGSLIGSLAETQEILDFCAEHNIASEVEVIAIDGINEAYDKVVKGEARYRYVIDAGTFVP